MKILIYGNPNSIFVIDYIKYVLLAEDKEIQKIVLLSNSPMVEINIDYTKFYEDNNIDVVGIININKYIMKIPKVRGLIFRLKSNYERNKSMRNLIFKYHTFDTLHIHCVVPAAADLIRKYSNFFNNIISTFWGSDLLRAERKNYLKLNYILNKSHCITVSTEVMKNVTECTFDIHDKTKLKLASFGLSPLEYIKKLELQESIDKSKEILSLPKDKIIIHCGYNASREQQHKYIINALNKCNESTLNKIFVILLMTYPSNNEYINEIKNYLNNSIFQYKIITSFLYNENIARLRRTGDILIHAQITDAFSGSISEHIYCNNIVFNGSWLEYPVLDENGIYYNKFDNEDDLSYKLEHTILHLEDEKAKVKENSKKIYDICSWQSVRKQWLINYK
ncbi:glycosyltransferase [Mobilitalea sibirica]|uniref:Glycosyltransferase n=1 Tax=Mobilitalea sibirica TaxID=1462919 RepID=A0A8J7H485_9FIRM|nr:glycosyltransferase [Mobilitalea sibirica]MBH1942060.1 glycosyltransferase [Mobilitalea sibirica]